MKDEDDFAALTGQTITGVYGNREELLIRTMEGLWRLSHDQDCCERVMLEDVAGDLSDLVGQRVSQAEVVVSEAEGSDVYDSGTWTFYKINTPGGDVTLRWLGTSNGYYSESVDAVFQSVADPDWLPDGAKPFEMVS